MKLRSSETLEIYELFGADIDRVEYAILSHTWGDDEVTYEDIKSGIKSGNHEYKSKAGYTKLKHFCAQAEKRGIKWVWADTCCIDKTNNVELSEAINSMWKWYAGSNVCYAYLVDVPGDLADVSDNRRVPSHPLRQAFERSNYFNRAWTLQELIAPRKLVFYTKDWREIGDRVAWRRIITEFTGIHEKALQGNMGCLNDFSIAQRMSWACNRLSTRPEDIAYSLFGIFNVNMPLLYGEGDKKAFVRLQEAIMNESVDHSLFAWEPEPSSTATQSGIRKDLESTFNLIGPLAHHPRLFRNASDIHFHRKWDRPAFSMAGTTGLKLTVPLIRLPDCEHPVALLDCYRVSKSGEGKNEGVRLGIFVKELHDEVDQFARVEMLLAKDDNRRWERLPQKIRTIHLGKNIDLPNPSFVHPSRVTAFMVSHPVSFKTKETIFKAPDSTKWNPYNGSNWHCVCLLEETKNPRRLHRVQADIFLIMGYDSASDLAWFEVKPSNGESIQQIRAEVRSGQGSTEKMLKKIFVRKRLTVSVRMEEKENDLGHVVNAMKVSTEPLEEMIRNENSNGEIADILNSGEVSAEWQKPKEVKINNGDVIEMLVMGEETPNGIAQASARSESAEKKKKNAALVSVTVVVRPHYHWIEFFDRMLQAVRLEALEKFSTSTLKRLLQ